MDVHSIRVLWITTLVLNPILTVLEANNDSIRAVATVSNVRNATKKRKYLRDNIITSYNYETYILPLIKISNMFINMNIDV